TPRRSGRSRSLASRSRRRSCSTAPWVPSASVAIWLEEREHAAEERPQLGSRDDRVEMAKALVRLCRPEVLGQLLAGRLLDNSGAGEREKRARLGDDDVP